MANNKNDLPEPAATQEAIREAFAATPRQREKQRIQKNSDFLRNMRDTGPVGMMDKLRARYAENPEWDTKDLQRHANQLLKEQSKEPEPESETETESDGGDEE